MLFFFFLNYYFVFDWSISVLVEALKAMGHQYKLLWDVSELFYSLQTAYLTSCIPSSICGLALQKPINYCLKPLPLTVSVKSSSFILSLSAVTQIAAFCSSLRREFLSVSLVIFQIPLLYASFYFYLSPIIISMVTLIKLKSPIRTPFSSVISWKKIPPPQSQSWTKY